MVGLFRSGVTRAGRDRKGAEYGFVRFEFAEWLPRRNLEWQECEHRAQRRLRH
jgi:hypothetical protein